MNQIDIPEYQYYLDCNAKRTVRLTFLEKSSYFNRSYRLIRLFYFQKYGNFYRIKELFKVNQNDIPNNQRYLGPNAKTTVRLTFLEKKFVFQSELSTHSRILFSKI